jgi:hypothetical protein
VRFATLCLLPDGRLASGSSDETIRMWDIAAGIETARLEGHSSAVATLLPAARRPPRLGLLGRHHPAVGLSRRVETARLIENDAPTRLLTAPIYTVPRNNPEDGINGVRRLLASVRSDR